MDNFKRRKFLQAVATLTAATGLSNFSFAGTSPNQISTSVAGNRFKISLNAYSFNEPLKNGHTTLETVMEFCATEGFDAIDLTAYYFPGYPQVPADEYLFNLKRKAHQLGLQISGTGIRNEFVEADKIKRDEQVTFVKNWIEAAAKLGAPVIRIFTGKMLPLNYKRPEVTGWIVEAVKACVEHGKKHGVIVALQNHNDFIKIADEATDIVKKVNSQWFGLVLDPGSFATLDPYDETKKAAAFAVNWQIKENLSNNGKIIPTDLHKLFRIILASPYRGFLPIETLNAGDPFVIVPPFLQKVKAALEDVYKV